MKMADVTRIERTRGTPQGEVVSPVLANLFPHYAFDRVSQHLSSVRFCRYGDDGVIYCSTTAAQAEYILRLGAGRFRVCGLELHPEKTRIVYCGTINRPGVYPVVQFTFLSYALRPRKAVAKRQMIDLAVNPNLPLLPIKPVTLDGERRS